MAEAIAFVGSVTTCTQLLSYCSFIISTLYDIERTDRTVHKLQQQLKDLNSISNAIIKEPSGKTRYDSRDGRDCSEALKSIVWWVPTNYVSLNPLCSSDLSCQPMRAPVFQKSRWFTRSWTLQALHCDIEPGDSIMDPEDLVSRLRTLTVQQASREGSDDIKERYDHISCLVHAACKTITHEQMEVNRPKPRLWRLLQWIKDPDDGHTLKPRIRLPKVLLEPSPMMLLLAWLVLALSVTTYYHRCSRNKYRGVILISSAAVAIAIGVMEGTSVSSMILTDLPWCLTAGIIADMVMHRMPGVASDSQQALELPSGKMYDKRCGREEIC